MVRFQWYNRFTILECDVSLGIEHAEEQRGVGLVKERMQFNASWIKVLCLCLSNWDCPRRFCGPVVKRVSLELFQESTVSKQRKLMEPTSCSPLIKCAIVVA